MSSNKWTKKQEEKLIDLKKNYGWRTVSRFLRRTEKACKSKYWKIMTAYAPKKRRSRAENNRGKSEWNEAEKTMLKENIKKGTSMAGLAFILRRPVKGIKEMIKKLEALDRKNKPTLFDKVKQKPKPKPKEKATVKRRQFLHNKIKRLTDYQVDLMLILWPDFDLMESSRKQRNKNAPNAKIPKKG